MLPETDTNVFICELPLDCFPELIHSYKVKDSKTSWFQETAKEFSEIYDLPILMIGITCYEAKDTMVFYAVVDTDIYNSNPYKINGTLTAI
jgi:hypothetical protein